jgi:hypothetical protein
VGERFSRFGDDALSVVGLVREHLNRDAVELDVVEQAPQDLLRVAMKKSSLVASSRASLLAR